MPICHEASESAILASHLALGLIDRYLAGAGYSGQSTGQPTPVDAPDNLFKPVKGDFDSHGRFDECARDHSFEMFTDRHKYVATALVAIALVAVAAQALRDFGHDAVRERQAGPMVRSWDWRTRRDHQVRRADPAKRLADDLVLLR